MGFPTGTTIAAQTAGTGGGSGTYSLKAMPVVFVGSISGTILTVSQVISGVLGVDTVIAGIGVAANTAITALGTGTGTYTIGTSQTVGAPALMYGSVTVASKPMSTMAARSASRACLPDRCPPARRSGAPGSRPEHRSRRQAPQGTTRSARRRPS